MTNDMLLGGLMILTMVAGIVIALTSKRDSSTGVFDDERSRNRDKDRRR
tara:strand:+ start:4258 stop:4404 length:147 start_codon:yes stop_codon:yes gene_type:complete